MQYSTIFCVGLLQKSTIHYKTLPTHITYFRTSLPQGTKVFNDMAFYSHIRNSVSEMGRKRNRSAEYSLF